jgi:hypothetical protein
LTQPQFLEKNMLLRLVSFGLATATLLVTGVAFADDAVIMDNAQENIVTGKRIKTSNLNDQRSLNDGNRRGSTGTSMRNSQVNDAVGEDINAENSNIQNQRIKRRSR